MTTPTPHTDQIQKLSVELSLILNYETRLERTTQLTQLLTLVLFQAPFMFKLFWSTFSELFTCKIGIMYMFGLSLIYSMMSVRLLWKSNKVLEFTYKLKHHDTERNLSFLPKTLISDKLRHHRYRIRMCFAVLVLGVAPYLVWILQTAQLTIPKQLWSS
jgi:hypothetical protein